jgi:MSHA pilin protein MshC
MRIEKNAGFTIMEIVAVLIVMGIVVAFAIGRGVSPGNEVSVQSEILKTHLRHTQVRALNSNIHWGIRTDAAGNSYWMFSFDGTNTTKVRLPGENADDVDLAARGLTMSAGTYTFDSRGIPYFTVPSGTPGQVGTELGANQSITITKGAQTGTITITKNTGFVP